jgi:branched-chain amino acid transport system permease protein
MLTAIPGLVLDGVAYGMLLFVLACGLSVTLGLMNFVNLAHGAFAMAGGYLVVALTMRLDMPFPWALPVAFVAIGLLGMLAYVLVYRHIIRRSHLDQVLFSIGVVFMSIAAMDWFMGSQQQFARLPAWLQGRVEFGARGEWGLGAYRLFIIALCGVIALLLQWALAKTRFGSRLRAAVDDPPVASGLGINVDRVFLITFGVGSGLAGLGGALGTEILGLEPTFPLKFMIYFLVVVAVGGTSSITGPLLASLLLGIADVVGKYYVPNLGAFIIYSLMIAILMVRPQGLFARGAS